MLAIAAIQLQLSCIGSRHREQARSHSWIGVQPKKQVGCQAAFASKLAPTVDRGTAGETGRLSGRLREQARSHRGNAVPQNQVGYQAASRWMLISAPH